MFAAEPSLIAPEEHRWFDKLKRAEQRQLLDRAKVARACPAKYRDLSGFEAARRVSKAGLPPLLTAISDGVIVYR